MHRWGDEALGAHVCLRVRECVSVTSKWENSQCGFIRMKKWRFWFDLRALYHLNIYSVIAEHPLSQQDGEIRSFFALSEPRWGYFTVRRKEYNKYNVDVGNCDYLVLHLGQGPLTHWLMSWYSCQETHIDAEHSPSDLFAIAIIDIIILINLKLYMFSGESRQKQPFCCIWSKLRWSVSVVVIVASQWNEAKRLALRSCAVASESTAASQ